jgi:hypothetical protein
MMQTDVKAFYTTSSSTVLVFNGRTRVRGITLTPNSSSNPAATLYDASTTSITGLTSIIAYAGDSNSMIYTIALPGEGVLFYKGIVLVPSLTASVTIIYG